MSINYVEQIFDKLHQMPETAFMEVKTAAVIADELKAMGYTVVEGIGETGLIGFMDGASRGQTLAIRADMDALPFEIDGKPVAIHACGHDANSSMVLAAAKRIAQEGIERGRIIFLFQPAEEQGKGAKAMMASGQLPKIDEMCGIHLRDDTEAMIGQATPAVHHSGAAAMRVKIIGQGCHGARPHQGINPVEVAISMVQAVNAIRVNPKVPHSVKVTKINTPGQAINVIPAVADMALDLRAHSPQVMEDLIHKTQACLKGVAQAYEAQADIEIPIRIEAAQYDKDMIQTAREAIDDVLGEALDEIYTPGGEDFHFFTAELGLKSTIIGLGGGIVNGLHHPQMRFDRSALGYGRDILTAVIHKRLGRSLTGVKERTE